MSDVPPKSGVRDLALRGSAYMAARQGLAVVIGVVGVVILTREIGPFAYGRYVGGLAIVGFLTTLARFGVEIFLIRRPEKPDSQMYHTAFTIMLVNGVVVASLGYVLAPMTIGLIVGPSFVRPFQVLVLAAPFSLLLAPGLAALEREMRYRRVALVEFLNPVVFYAVAVPWAITSPSVWSPVAGYVAAQGFTLIATIVVSDAPVGLAWSWTDVREMLRFGAPFTLMAIFAQGRQLVNPIVVGGLLGPAAVGNVGIALRIADMLCFVSRAGSRVSVAALSRLVGERERLGRALAEGMFLQILAVAPFYAGFALISRSIIPMLLGKQWDEAVAVFPLIAAAAMVFAFMSLPTSLLFVLGRSGDVVVSSMVSVALLAGGAAAAIRISDSPTGYGVGEVLSVAGLWIVVTAARRYVPIDYASFVPWLVASIAPFFFPWVGLPWGLALYLPVIGLLSRRSEREKLRRYLRYVIPGQGRRVST